MTTRALEVDPANTSRVELEPYLAKIALDPERQADAEAIRAELASRPWQGPNPYE